MRHPFSLPLLALSFAIASAPMRLAAEDTCPVGLSASWHSLGALLPAHDPDLGRNTAQPQAQAAQAVDLSIMNTRLQRIVAAELAVHGTANKGRLSSLSRAAQPAADAVRTVHLESSVPADQSRTSTVTVRDLTSIGWISVTELRYADGSTWHVGPGRSCEIIPSGMMLIAGR